MLRETVISAASLLDQFQRGHTDERCQSLLDGDDAGQRTPLHRHADDAPILADNHIIDPRDLSLAGTDAKHDGRPVLPGDDRGGLEFVDPGQQSRQDADNRVPADERIGDERAAERDVRVEMVFQRRRRPGMHRVEKGLRVDHVHDGKLLGMNRNIVGLRGGLKRHPCRDSVDIVSTPAALTMIQLTCFLAVAETGSFAAAGRRLGMTTSGVSKTIGRLEQARTIRLLNRSTHAVSLTDDGERLLPLAREALRAVEKADAAISVASRDGVSGRVRITAPTAVLTTCLVPLLPQFQAALPRIKLDLRGSDRLVDLADEAVDLAIRSGPLDGIPGHRAQILCEFPWVTCAAPDYLARRGTPSLPEDLEGHDLIGFRNQRTGIVEPWRYAHPQTGAPKNIRVSAGPAVVLDDACAAAAAAVSGIGIIWAPNWLVSEPLRVGALMPLLSEWAGKPMRMSIVRREGRVSGRTRSVIEFLRTHRAAFA